MHVTLVSQSAKPAQPGAPETVDAGRRHSDFVAADHRVFPAAGPLPGNASQRLWVGFLFWPRRDARFRPRNLVERLRALRVRGAFFVAPERGQSHSELVRPSNVYVPSM